MLLIGTENPVGFRVDSPGFDMVLERERDGVFLLAFFPEQFCTAEF